MKKSLLFASFFFGIIFQIFAQYNIGKQTITFTDASRGNRNIETDIFYPAITNGNNASIINEKFPVIIMGHGFVMTVNSYENLSDYFVPKGYIIILPKTEGSFSPNHAAFGEDIRFLANQILVENNNSSSFFNNKILDKIALMGHSMGGGAALLASENNNAISAYVGLASAETSTSAIDAAANVNVPFLMLAGSEDAVTPPSEHQILMYENYNNVCKTYLELNGGGHCLFANSNFNCNIGEAAVGGNITLSRAEQQGLLNKYVGLWLDYYLKDDCESWQEFNNEIRLSDSLEFRQDSENYPEIIYENGNLILSKNPNIYQSINWFESGNFISDNNQVENASEGIYSVEVELNDSCSVINNFELNFVNVNSTIFNDFDFKIFPNPIKSNQQTISYNVDGKILYELYDISGKLIFSNIAINKEIRLEKPLKQGVYIINIISDDENIRSSKRIIVI